MGAVGGCSLAVSTQVLGPVSRRDNDVPGSRGPGITWETGNHMQRVLSAAAKDHAPAAARLSSLVADLRFPKVKSHKQFASIQETGRNLPPECLCIVQTFAPCIRVLLAPNLGCAFFNSSCNKRST